MSSKFDKVTLSPSFIIPEIKIRELGLFFKVHYRKLNKQFSTNKLVKQKYVRIKLLRQVSLTEAYYHIMTNSISNFNNKISIWINWTNWKWMIVSSEIYWILFYSSLPEISRNNIIPHKSIFQLKTSKEAIVGRARLWIPISVLSVK